MKLTRIERWDVRKDGPLTEAALQRKIEGWIESAQGRGQSGYLLILGMDRLSLMNEAFGSHFVDELIETTQNRLVQLMGKSRISERLIMDGTIRIASSLLGPRAGQNRRLAAPACQTVSSGGITRRCELSRYFCMPAIILVISAR